MSRTAQTILVLAITLTVGGLAAVALGAAKANGRVIAEMRQELAARWTDHDLADAARAEEQRKREQVWMSRVDELNRQVTGLLLRRPPRVDYAGFINSDKEHKRRIEQIERAIWAGK